MELLKKLLMHLKRRVPALVLCVVVFSCFGLYYLGVFDISFIKRPAAWQNNSAMLYAVLFPEKKQEEPKTEETTAPLETDNNTGEPPSVIEGEDAETQDLISAYTVMPKSGELAEAGYRLSDKTFDEACRFALLETSFSLPKNFSYTKKTYDKVVAKEFEDGTEATTETVSVTEDRPAIELYMGYIIYDDKGTLYLIGADGTALTRYDDTKYIPAYTRDKQGRPLFYNTYKYQMDYPTSTGEPDENGDSEWTSKATLNLTGKNYFYLGKDGRTFAKSDYNDAADNRGLYFDYPAYYGITDSKLNRYYKESTKVETSLKGKTTVLPSMKWLYRSLTDYSFDPDAETTVYPYTMAYSYKEGYAVVCADIDWSYTDEDKVVEVKSNELQVVNESGRIMFNSRKNFVNNYNWTANEKYSEPLLRDLSSIGSYYFNEGLLRIRLQSYDRYSFTEYNIIRMVSDEDILVRPNGSRFYTPAGYKLEAYSDGMILLSKDGKYGYMNSSGRWVVQPKLDDAKPYLEGVAVVQSYGKYGVIDKKGEYVVPPRYDYISNISSGVIAAFSEDNGWEIYIKMTV